MLRFQTFVRWFLKRLFPEFRHPQFWERIEHFPSDRRHVQEERPRHDLLEQLDVVEVVVDLVHVSPDKFLNIFVHWPGL